jgi:hypothetical protein
VVVQVLEGDYRGRGLSIYLERFWEHGLGVLKVGTSTLTEARCSAVSQAPN